MIPRILLTLLSAALLSAQTFPPRRSVPSGRAEVMYYNGKIITMDPEQPVAEALTLADGRILAVGTTQQVGRTIGPATKQINLEGRTVVPGLIDSHVHPIGAALAEMDGEIPVMASFAELEAHVEREMRKNPGNALIFVPKVYSTRLDERRYPTRQEIDAWSGDRPVMLDNGYASALNSAALAVAGLNKETPDPPDGKIIRDDAGEPTGLVLGARRLVSPLLSARQTTFEDSLEALVKMQHAYNKAGLTSVIDRSLSPSQIAVYQKLWSEDKLTVRTYMTRTVNAERPIAEIESELRALGPVTGFGDPMLRMGSLKIFLDGGILIGTAFLRAPYGMHTEVYGYSDPDYRGVLRVERETINAIAVLCDKLGWQMTAHTTGGASTDALLDAYEAADKIASIKDRRFTLTHANFPNADAIARAAKLGVVLDMQPAWYHHDGPALSKVLGPERMKWFQPYKSVFDAGVIVAGGSDHMIKFDSRKAINPYNPFFGMWMVVTRKTSTGEVFNPEQKLTREQALKMWTWNAAYLSFDEDVKGSLEAGKYADMVILDRDILTCPEDEIQWIEPIQTILGGKVIYDSGDAL
ncbi:MAG: amidohydrolase [Acidobacteria bacterium]|nr:amidohydrolase [Acidobacteriota bacterium]